MKINILIISFQALTVLALGQSDRLHGQWRGQIVKDDKIWTTEINIYLEEQKLKGDFDLPDYGLHHLVFNDIQMMDSILSLEYKDRRSEATFKGILKANYIAGDWVGLGMTATFSLMKINKIPTQFQTEEVSFTNREAKLSGTLILPSGKGPFPAIVQVHGSGNQTRSEDFYKSRAYLFARHGIAVLIYDRRGKGSSTGSNVSMELLADDAIAGVHLLQQNPLIKKSKIGIMGFSQGGYVGPLAASRSNDVAFIIAGSAPGVTPDEQNDFDVENSLRNGRLSEDSISIVLHFRKDLRNYQYNLIGDKNKLESQLGFFRTRQWFRNTLLTDASVEPVDEGVKKWLSFDPLPVWKKVKVPKLIIWGELDKVVPVVKSKKLIEDALKEAGSKNYQLKIYQNSSHGIAVVDNGRDWDWPRLADGYHQTMIEWTKRVVK